MLLLCRQIIDLVLERFSDRFQLHVLDAGAKPDVARPTVTYIQGDIQVCPALRLALPCVTVDTVDTVDTADTEVVHCSFQWLSYALCG